MLQNISISKTMTNSRLIIEMTCIDEGNAWGLNYGQKVYYAENFPFVMSPFDAMNCKSKSLLTSILKKIIDEGNFMPEIRTLTFTIS